MTRTVHCQYENKDAEGLDFVPWPGELGKRVFAGIGKPAFEAQVELIEPVGNEVFVNLVYAGQTLVARMPPQRLPEPGETLRVTVEGATPHLFDPDTGLRLP